MSNLKFLVSLKLLEGDSNKIFISSINLFINKKMEPLFSRHVSIEYPLIYIKLKKKLFKIMLYWLWKVDKGQLLWDWGRNKY